MQCQIGGCRNEAVCGYLDAFNRTKNLRVCQKCFEEISALNAQRIKKTVKPKKSLKKQLAVISEYHTINNKVQTALDDMEKLMKRKDFQALFKNKDLCDSDEMGCVYGDFEIYVQESRGG